MPSTPFRWPRRLALCLLSALLVCFCFPNIFQKTLHPPFAFFAWFSLIPFFLALQGAKPRQGALLGYFFGFAHLGGILYWIALLEEAQYLSVPAWGILVGYLSLYFGAFGLLFTWLVKKFPGSPPLLAAVIWVALESLRGTRPWGGFSWGELGYSQAPYPLVLSLTIWAGIQGLTFLMVWFNAALAQWALAWRAGKGREAGPSLVWPAGFLLLGLVLGGWVIFKAPTREVGTVLLLQPSIDQSVKWSPQNEKETYRILGELVQKAGPSRPSLVVWPETAAPSYLLASPGALEKVAGIVKRSGTFHLVGCLHQEYQPSDELRQYNAAVFFGPGGDSRGFYGKRHLVPFGEFVPFQKQLSFLGPVVGELGSFFQGPRHEAFAAEDFTFSPMICYEAVFPGDVRMASRTGAQVLVNISNDAWYGRTASAYQHALMAVAACAGVRKPLLRSSNTGICLATDPFGKILASTRLFDRTILKSPVVRLPQSPTTPYTPYERWGDWLSLGCWVGLLFLFFKAYRKGRDGKR